MNQPLSDLGSPERTDAPLTQAMKMEVMINSLHRYGVIERNNRIAGSRGKCSKVCNAMLNMLTTVA